MYTKQDIVKLLETSNKAVVRALVVLHSLQTYDEQVSASTHHDNKMGFNGADARILTEIFNFYNKTNFLSDKQINLIRKKVIKYANQLSKVANGIITVNV